ncbi:Dual-specificity kinase protein [Dioscorea alata]|uniref:Dual-specificity kinase protein n=1 Tax=Dioscorea alata TaxID=55571 RepID=A0ACB7UM44_DIOAL|nr:Dual-specificity kinase protein [Dioscorea alata]
MDSRNGEKDGGVDVKEGGFRSKLKGFGSFGSKDMFVRPDKIDLKSLDIQLETKMNKRPKEEWEIDVSKLDVRYVLARGTYGTVYRGSYDGQEVAVKLLDWGEDGFATDAETAALRASFQQEVAVWHKLDHPNVTKFVGASMGTSELKILEKNSTSNGQKRKKLSYKIVIQLALDPAQGLSYLHSRKIVHRDVKTENMLLDTQRTSKIADFGVARVEAQNPQDMTGETGTLGYMAPEVLNGKPYNRKCDVHSFGICLWEIYCCDLPCPDLSFAQVSAVVRQARPNADKRPDMDEVVRLLEVIDTSKGGGMIPEDQKMGCLCFAKTRGP